MTTLEITENLIPQIGSENVKHQPAEVSTEEPPKDSKKFRINAKKIFLIYSHTNLSPTEVLDQLNKKFLKIIKKYLISEEEHSDELKKGKRIHVFIEFNKKVNISSSRKLDLVELGKVIQGEYQSVKNSENIIGYIKKDGNFVSNFQTNTNIEFELNLQKIALEDGLEKALKYFCSTKPETVSTQLHEIQRNLALYISLFTKKTTG